MRYVIKCERLSGVPDLYLASKRMTQIPYCQGIEHPDIMIWKTREAAEKYITKNFAGQNTDTNYFVLERE